MVQLKDFLGSICRFKSKSECSGSGVATPVVPDIVRGHMVLVLSAVLEKIDHVKVMTITTKLKYDGDYVPISPTPKKGFAIQLRLRNHLEWYHGDALLFLTALPKNSYLKIDSYYEVPIQMLYEAVDNFGKPLKAWLKHQGGLGELRNHVRRRDQIRENIKLCKELSFGKNDV